MSRNGTLLEIPPGSELEATIATLTELWPGWSAMQVPRSVWLKAVEDELRTYYPTASSADRKLTARHLAPFPLALGPNTT